MDLSDKYYAAALVLPNPPIGKPPVKKAANKKALSPIFDPVYQAAMSADNVRVSNPLVPVNKTKKALDLSKKIVSNNSLEVEKDKYYNPEFKDVHSGDKFMDALYRNQWLINTPVVGDVIKSRAYDLVKNSSGEFIYNKDSKETFDKNKRENKVWKGTLDGVTGEPDKMRLPGADLLGQYFGKTNLPAAKYKPTSNYLPFLPQVSIKQNFDKDEKYQDLTSVFNDLPELTPEKYKALIEKGEPFYKQYDSESALSRRLNVDLGGHKVGMAFDKEKNLPYISISDAWDFSPKDYAETYETKSNFDEKKDPSYVQASLMHKAGKPFKVYDRFYFDPKTKKYIPDSKLPK